MKLRRTPSASVFLAALVSLLPLLHAGRKASEDAVFVGWQGEMPRPSSNQAAVNVSDSKVADAKRPWVQVLSWKPRAFVYHNFLSDEEAAHIIKLSAPQMKRSRVVGADKDGDIHDIRTSAGTFLVRNIDPVITAVDHRLAMWSGLPPSFQEDMQVLRYGPTNKYGAHLDGLERVASVLIYLVAPEEGGETAFPNSNGWLHPEMGEAAQGPFSECAKGHVAYKPKRGDALMFFDLKPDYTTPDDFSMHTGCPVVKGVKWNAVKWLHGKPFNEQAYNESLITRPRINLDPGVCEDTHDSCKMWAAAGECEKNPGFMLGSDNPGGCRLSCKGCTPCAAGDTACMEANRRKGGYLVFDEAELKLGAGSLTGAQQAAA